MARERVMQWVNLLFFVLIVLKTEGSTVNLTYVETAVPKGAVCLDGSPPAYHFEEGFGTGADNWLVFVEGGGWCNNVENCKDRASSSLGSSKLMEPVNFTGILSNQQTLNPDFFNWNRVKVRYCDGASFTGDIEEVDPANNIYFRGARIFPAVIEDLLAKGMKNAKNALLSGCSAGGLTSILHCDYFKAHLPNVTKVKCLSDGGFFINVKDVSKRHHIEDFYEQVVSTHGSAKNLPGKCTKKMKPGLCFFPQNMAKDIRIPLFILNPAYDSWQISNILAPDDADPRGLWLQCKYNLSKCTADQLNTVQDFRLQFLKALNGLGASTSRGMFVNSCYEHCQSEVQETWLASGSPELNKTAIATAAGDWYYDRRPFQEIDCAYPCNPTCRALD